MFAFNQLLDSLLFGWIGLVVVGQTPTAERDTASSLRLPPLFLFTVFIILIVEFPSFISLSFFEGFSSSSAHHNYIVEKLLSILLSTFPYRLFLSLYISSLFELMLLLLVSLLLFSTFSKFHLYY